MLEGVNYRERGSTRAQGAQGAQGAAAGICLGKKVVLARRDAYHTMLFLEGQRRGPCLAAGSARGGHFLYNPREKLIRHL